ncbi:MAG: FitA-like ribbon-helix-helix domain-containing protein [Candidatus Xenobia bacterium]
MANLSIRGLPDELHRLLQDEARDTHRSINAIVIEALKDHAAQQDRRRRLAHVFVQMDALRNGMGLTSDSAELIREDRER